MAFSKKRNREYKKKPYPRIWLNVKRRYHSLTFLPICTKLSQSRFEAYKAEGKMPAQFSIPILMKDVRNVLFHSEKQVYIHQRVAKYLILNTSFRNALKRELKACTYNVKAYEKKLKLARIARSKTHWKEKIRYETERELILKDLRASLLNSI